MAEIGKVNSFNMKEREKRWGNRMAMGQTHKANAI
jgi:hypothetical protein